MDAPMMDPIQEKQQFNMRIKKITKIFDTEIDDDNIREFIFDDTDVRRCVRNLSGYVSFINNILTLAFIFAHGCYHADLSRLEPKSLSAEKHSSLRIINSLRKAYAQYPATAELMQFVLTDIQFDVLSEKSELADIFNCLCDFHAKDFNLTAYYKLIAKWKQSPARFTMNSNELAGMFCKLLESMTFLRSYRLEKDEDGGFCFLEKNYLEYGEEGDFSVIPVRRLIFSDETKYSGLYPLFSVEKVGQGRGKSLNLRYISTNGYNTIPFTVTNDPTVVAENLIMADAEEYYSEITGVDWDFNFDGDDVKKNSNLIDQVHAINYKYIKNLALAISDAICVNMDAKEAICKAFAPRHPDIFGKGAERAALDWDGIVVMLLIESSPTNVLEVIFRASRQSFFNIAANLSKRIDNPDMPIWGLNDKQLEAKVGEIIRNRLILGESDGFGRLRHSGSERRLFPRAAASLIVSSLAAILEEKQEEKAICAGNIYDNISLLSKTAKEDTPEVQCKYVSVILAESFRHLLCFYRGILAYGEIKSRFDAESCNTFFTEARISQYQKKLHAAFMDAAKKEMEAIREFGATSDGIFALIDRFILLCEESNSSMNSSASAGHSLYVALGKHEILNVNEFRELINNDLYTLEEINHDNVKKWIEFAQRILAYFRTGGTEGEAWEKTMFRTVYPMAATYNRGNENYDGYKTVTFSLNIDVDMDGESDKAYISVLTEFNYNLNDVFYCLPNVLRSNRKWWIDPVLISYKEFNDIFTEEEPLTC